MERSFFLLTTFYFIKHLTFKPAPFHELLYQNFQDLMTGIAKQAAGIAHCDSAKTSIVKIGGIL